ncbi:MAG: hypothetical protein ABI647_00870 [Gemmatimonadota bacterium]
MELQYRQLMHTRSRERLPKRLFRRLLIVQVAVVLSLGVGTLGYVTLAGDKAIDGFLNASMLLGGMGPVGEINGTAGKLFASFYALYSGLFFILSAGFLTTPLIHHMLLTFHVEDAQ